MENDQQHVTRNAAKNDYNKINYRQVATRVKPELEARIRAYRQREGISMSQFLTRAIDTLEKQQRP